MKITCKRCCENKHNDISTKNTKIEEDYLKLIAELKYNDILQKDEIENEFKQQKAMLNKIDDVIKNEENELALLGEEIKQAIIENRMLNLNIQSISENSFSKEILNESIQEEIYRYQLSTMVLNEYKPYKEVFVIKSFDSYSSINGYKILFPKNAKKDRVNLDFTVN